MQLGGCKKKKEAGVNPNVLEASQEPSSCDSRSLALLAIASSMMRPHAIACYSLY